MHRFQLTVYIHVVTVNAAAKMINNAFLSFGVVVGFIFMLYRN